MLTTAGVAVADDGTSSGTGTQASSNAGGDAKPANTARDRKLGGKPRHARTSESKKTESTETESKETESKETESDKSAPDKPEKTTAPEVTSPEAADPAAEEAETGKPERKPLRDLFGGGKHRAPEPEAAPEAEVAAESAVESAVEPVVAPAPAEAVAEPQRRVRPSTFATGVETDLGAPDGAMVMRIAAADAPPVQTQPTLLDVLNTIGKKFYDFYTDTMQFFAGPVRAPFGSSVRVESSTLTIGGHKDVPADWYFPDTDTPAGLIYLQHGFLANASFYSATAAYLAEKTDSIVVVPSLTWNPFDVENYPLEWPSTGRAIAALFAGDRAALTASARAAGYDGVLPTKVVLAGHSAGGGLVAMVGRYMVETGNADDLAGLIMFDGVGTLSFMGQDIAAIPTSIPVYNIAAGPSSWNWYGDTNRKLRSVRPGMFTGVTFRDGSHADGMQTTAPIVQYFAYLAMGHSSPLDVLANKVLAAGWINDMLDGTHTDRLYDSDASAWSVVTGWWWDQLTSSSTRRVRTVTL
ncbi:alpha/beta hydrolase [Mycobacterium sp. PSTR-4-N]|uniref:alpha/beta hydrolase n=1 Tax=Mycobacterium sp. PSTR-4-N TaxID=2917745 RepID=UPI001F153BC7|nr:alpha/beta hydrolase [Mycobacterium sp. PSTR-4-N]MCG7595058.1 alpha/beta hydrolase [Mycobacterium sp. PSTR-4-N]